jgi:hypothetical protein
MCERWQIDTQKPRARQKVPPTKQAESHVYDRKREQEKDRLSLRARMRASACVWAIFYPPLYLEAVQRRGSPKASDPTQSLCRCIFGSEHLLRYADVLHETNMK